MSKVYEHDRKGIELMKDHGLCELTMNEPYLCHGKFLYGINQLISEDYVVLCDTRSDAVKIDRSMLAKQK